LTPPEAEPPDDDRKDWTAATTHAVVGRSMVVLEAIPAAEVPATKTLKRKP